MSTLPARGRLLGVDLGDVRLGLAVTDPDQRVATPSGTLAVEAPADLPRVARTIAASARERDAVGVVIGLPLTPDGREASAAQRARKVAQAMPADLPVALWDERFSTLEAERAMAATGAGTREQRRSSDRVAAALILRGFLEARDRGSAS